jgi:PKD repeat protein
LAIGPPSPNPPVENQPVTFTITPGVIGTGSAIIRNVVVDFGDGGRDTLPIVSGPTTVSHIYQSNGTFRVSATGTDINGETVSGTIIVAVNEQLPLAVTLSASPSTARRGVDTVRFTAIATGGSAIRYEWDFGDGTNAITTGGSTEHFYPDTTPLGAVRVRVRVISSNAADGLGETTVIITTP